VFTVYTMYETMMETRLIFLDVYEKAEIDGGSLLVDIWSAYLSLWVGASNHRKGIGTTYPLAHFSQDGSGALLSETVAFA